MFFMKQQARKTRAPSAVVGAISAIRGNLQTYSNQSNN